MAAAVLGLALAAAGAAAQRPYTVDDMLRLESLGNVSFSKDGQTLIFDRYGPFEEQPAFDRGYVLGETRSKIYAVDLRRRSQPRLLFPQRKERGYAHASLSPDGRSLLYTEASRDGYALGVASATRGDPRRLRLPSDVVPSSDAEWFAGDNFALPAVRRGDLDLYTFGLRRPQARLVEQWLQAFNGTAATASVIGSGRFASLPRPEGRLVVGNASDGSLFTLSPGAYGSPVPSPDGRLVAALREAERMLNPHQRVNLSANMGRRRTLVVFTPHPGSTPFEPCPRCDVLTGSLAWRSDGARLAFFAREEGADWSTGQFRTFDARTRRTSAVPLGALRPKISSYGGEMQVDAAWLGADLAILAGTPDAQTGEINRADWYVYDGERLRNLTAGFAGDVHELSGTAPDALLLVDDGELWKVDASGVRANLTSAITAGVIPWQSPTPVGGPPLDDVQPSPCATVEVEADGNTPGQLLLIDTRSGRTDVFTAPSPRSSFVAVSPAAKRAAVIDRSGNLTRLLVLSAGGEAREIVTLNEHLRKVVGGMPVRIDHKGPRGDSRMSWMLLPPDYKPGTAVPTIVNVYPGAVGGETFSGSRLDDVNALSDHVLAARGYAVLHPSLPVDYEKVPREPLSGLVDEVFAAVDAAVARGYTDPRRLAVQGHSYGGYAAGALVGLTNRFKTAVALAGSYDLVSAYGTFDVRQRLEHPVKGLDLLFVHSLESSQGGMGAPPWDDPQRYLRNSPLMHVKDVKTPIMLITGDLDFVPTTQTEEFFTALTRLNKDAVMVRYWGEEHVLNSPANIRDMWSRIFDWYDQTLR